MKKAYLYNDYRVPLHLANVTPREHLDNLYTAIANAKNSTQLLAAANAYTYYTWSVKSESAAAATITARDMLGNVYYLTGNK